MDAIDDALRTVFFATQTPFLLIKADAPKFTIEEVNQAYLNLTFTSKDIIGKGIFEVFPPFESDENSMNEDKLYLALEETINTRKITELELNEYEIRNPENIEYSNRYWSITNTPMFSENGTIRWIIHSPFDVTPYVKLRKKLEENEQRLELAISSSQIGVWDLDLTTGKAVRSLRQAQIYGYNNTSNEASVETFFDHILTEDLERAQNAFIEALETNFLDIELRIKKADNSIAWIRVKGEAYRDRRGEPVRMLGTTLDITKNKEMEQRKDELISLVGHELKTPVTSLKAHCQVLERRFINSEEQLASVMLRKMSIQINRLNTLINDILDVGKLQTGRLHLRPTEFLFDELALEIVNETAKAFPVHRFKVDIRQENLLVTADRDKTSQVIINLLTNAIKYSPGRDEVEVSVFSEDQQVVFSVKDFGKGIPLNKQQHIFERYYRVDEDFNHASGLGLGLYISAEIIKQQHGRIWLNSAPDQGSTFFFSLPLKAE